MQKGIYKLKVNKKVPLDQAKLIFNTLRNGDNVAEPKFKETKMYYVFDDVPKRCLCNLENMKFHKHVNCTYGDISSKKNFGSGFFDMLTKGKKIIRSLFGKKHRGFGFMDIIKDPVGYVKDLTTLIPTRLNNRSRATLEKYGNDDITYIQLCRTPLAKGLTGAINVISMGKLNEAKEKLGYDKLYHLFLLATTSAGQIRMEKNEVINITDESDVKSNTEFFSLTVAKPIKVFQFVENCRNLMGDEAWFSYDPLNNNCQIFIRALLKSNDLLTPDAEKFIMQDSQAIKETMGSIAPKIMRKITDLGSIASRIMGKGTGKELSENFMKHVHDDNVHIDSKNLDEKFIEWIHKDGLKFL